MMPFSFLLLLFLSSPFPSWELLLVLMAIFVDSFFLQVPFTCFSLGIGRRVASGTMVFGSDLVGSLNL